MKIATTFIFLCFLVGCKQMAKNNTEINQYHYVTNGTQQKKTIYEQIIRKEEKPDSFSKNFDYKYNYTGSEIKELNLDTSKIKSNEYYHLTNQKFLSNELDDLDFKIYYRFLYGYLSEKILRIERKDSIFDRLLSASGGDGQDTYDVSTKFENDSIFEERIVLKSTILDDPYLVAHKIEIISTRYQYSQNLDFKKLRVDSTKIPNSAFIDYPLDATNTNFELTEKDSLSLLRFWRKTAFNIIDTLNVTFSNAKIGDYVYDAFDGRGGLGDGSIYQSPDLYFKILTLKGESCGAYCNPFWNSEIILSNGTKISTEFFDEIENIYVMPDGKYLVLQQSYSRPASVFTVTTISAILFGIEDEKIIYYPFKHNYPKYNEISQENLYNPSGQLSFSQENFIDNEQWMTYNKESMQLKYKYGTDFRYCCNIDSAFIYLGEFKYENGEFKHIMEMKEYIKIE